MRFFLSLILTFLAIFGTFFAVGGEKLMVFLDIPSLMISVIFPMFYIIIIKGFIQFKTIFTKNIDKNISKGTLLKKYLLLKMYSKITWLSCILAFVIAILNFLLSFAFQNNMKALGPSVALISLSILYASIINIIITPFIMNTKEKLELLHE